MLHQDDFRKTYKIILILIDVLPNNTTMRFVWEWNQIFNLKKKKKNQNSSYEDIIGTGHYNFTSGVFLLLLLLFGVTLLHSEIC